MTDLDPEIWNNPTLGSVGAGPFLNELEAQQAEDYNARREGREPRVVEYVNRYPKMPESGSVPSIVQEFTFIDPGEITDEPREETPVAEDSDSPDPSTGDNTTGLPSFE